MPGRQISRFISASSAAAGMLVVATSILSGRLDITSVVTMGSLVYVIHASLFRPAPTVRESAIALMSVLVYSAALALVGNLTESMMLLGVVVLYVTLVGRPRLLADLDRRPTRMLCVGLFSAGAAYAVFAMLNGRASDPTTIIALTVEMLLVVASLRVHHLSNRAYLALGLLMVLFPVLALAMDLVTELVLMVSAGVAAYMILMSNPRFPLTKRALSTGLVVGTVMTFLGIYLSLKLGIIYFVGAEMLGAILLGARGGYTKEENTIVVTIANSSSMISVGTLITIPAIAIFDSPVDPIAPTLLTYEFIAFLTGMSAVLGIMLLLPFRERFENDPWPQVRPQAECIVSIGSDRVAKRNVLTGVLLSVGFSGSLRTVEQVTSRRIVSLPNALVGSVPEWIGLSTSPLIAAIGYFVGWKRAVSLVIGSCISLGIWLALEGAAPLQFSEHIRRPEILYLVLGCFGAIVTGDMVASRKNAVLSPTIFEEYTNHRNALLDDGFLIDAPHNASEIRRVIRTRTELVSISEIRNEIRAIIENPRAYLRSKQGRLPYWLSFLSLGIFTVVGVVVFSVLRAFQPLEIHWLLFILGAPLVLVSAYFTARAISETAMLAGYISDVIAIPAIVFLRVSFAAMTSFMAMVGSLQDSAIAALLHIKLGSLTGVRARDVLKAVFIGIMLATISGALMIYGIYRVYGFGGSDFPSPTAQLFGFLLTGLQGLSDFRLPGMTVPFSISLEFFVSFLYLMSFAVGGYLLGRELNRRGASAISLAVGFLIPPATSLAILLGGFLELKSTNPPSSETCMSQEVPNRQRLNRILSGIIAGEAIVTFLWVMGGALSLLLL
ncbi:MAG: OPT/YSL family transporter [Candidatus Thorarchaeota archaeon]